MIVKIKDTIKNWYYNNRYILKSPGGLLKITDIWKDAVPDDPTYTTEFKDSFPWLLAPGHGTCITNANSSYNPNNAIFSSFGFSGRVMAENCNCWYWKDQHKEYVKPPFPYSGYYIEYSNPVTFGRFDFIIKHDLFIDAWPCIWLWNSNNDPSKGDIFYEEINVCEIFNETGTKAIWCNTHIGNSYQDRDMFSRKIRNIQADSRYRMYSLIWAKDKVQILVNNKIVYINTHMVPQHDLRVVVSNGVSKHKNIDVVPVGDQKIVLGTDELLNFSYKRF